jgi:hypothetical protein
MARRSKAKVSGANAYIATTEAAMVRRSKAKVSGESERRKRVYRDG